MNPLREKLGSPRRGTITLSVIPPNPLAIRVIRDDAFRRVSFKALPPA